MTWPGEWVISDAMDEALRQLWPVKGMASFHSFGIYKKSESLVPRPGTFASLGDPD
jgi:hypothetical protein